MLWFQNSRVFLVVEVCCLFFQTGETSFLFFVNLEKYRQHPYPLYDGGDEVADHLTSNEGMNGGAMVAVGGGGWWWVAVGGGERSVEVKEKGMT